MPMLQPSIDAEAGVATNGGHRPTVVAAPASASPELSDRPRRRIFTARDKLRILAETDRAAGTGGIGAILRREGVYSSSLTEWRKQRDAGAFGALAPAKRGRKAAEPNPLAAKLAMAQRDNARLTLRLKRAEAIIDLKKKLRSCWASRWRRTATSLDASGRGTRSGQPHDRRGLCCAWGFTRQRAAPAHPARRTAGNSPAETATGTGVDRPATANRAGSVARAALRRPGAGRDLRQPAR